MAKGACTSCFIVKKRGIVDGVCTACRNKAKKEKMVEPEIQAEVAEVEEATEDAVAQIEEDATPTEDVVATVDEKAVAAEEEN